MKKTNILKLIPITLLLQEVFSFSQAQDKPNILVIWGDDIGTWNILNTNNNFNLTKYYHRTVKRSNWSMCEA
jgi:hypothetical protein